MTARPGAVRPGDRTGRLGSARGGRPSRRLGPWSLAGARRWPSVGSPRLLVALVLGVALGSVAIPLGDTLAILGHRLLGLDLARTWSDAAETIVIDLRLPRVLTSMTVGMGLAVAGATFQGLLRNPLADPYVLGTASGAALGAAIAVLLPVRVLILQFGLVHALAFLGALASVYVVYRLSRTSPLAPLTGPAAHRVRRRLAPRGRARDDDVPVRRRPAPDLRLPARRLRRQQLAPPGRGPADRGRRAASRSSPGPGS